MIKALVATAAVLIGLTGSQLPAEANSWYDYGYLKGCGMLLSERKHGTPRFWRHYMQTEFCRQRLANHKRNK